MTSCVLVGAVGLAITAAASGVRWNWSRSLPMGLYQVSEPVGVRVGDLVVVCPPPSVSALAIERGYLARGSCVGGSQPLLKLVIGFDDAVVVDDRGFLVKGRRMLFTEPRAQDAQGRPLAVREASGAGVWVAGPNAWSWDSRYWGPVPATAILGRAERILPPWPGNAAPLMAEERK